MKSMLFYQLLLATGMAVGISTTLPAASFGDFSATDIDGKPVALSSFAGKAVLVVNTASRCGFTPQYEGLEALYERYKNSGLVILGFPSNDFLGQEPGNEQEIKNFCTLNYNVSFPMFSKIKVNGKSAHPLYQWMTDKGSNPQFGGKITWNFNKFLIGPDGKVLARFDSAVKPDDPKLVQAIEAALTNVE